MRNLTMLKVKDEGTLSVPSSCGSGSWPLRSRGHGVQQTCLPLSCYTQLCPVYMYVHMCVCQYSH